MWITCLVFVKYSSWLKTILQTVNINETEKMSKDIARTFSYKGLTPIILNMPPMQFSLHGFSLNYKNLITNVRILFKKIAPIFGARMFIFSSYRPMTNKLLNTEYE
jgi:hypothetical protein